MSKKEFWTFQKLADRNYGIKGFEIRFQDMIEEYLEEQGVHLPWYKVYHTSLFIQILEIYEKNVVVVHEVAHENEEGILTGLQHLYDQVVDEVSQNVDKILEERKSSNHDAREEGDR